MTQTTEKSTQDEDWKIADEWIKKLHHEVSREVNIVMDVKAAAFLAGLLESLRAEHENQAATIARLREALEELVEDLKMRAQMAVDAGEEDEAVVCVGNGVYFRALQALSDTKPKGA